VLRRAKLAKGRQIDAVIGDGSAAIKPCPVQLFPAPTELAKGRQIDAVIGAGSVTIKFC
jgi:cytosine/adenosine deaminase-related metal-dependent hydrolase